MLGRGLLTNPFMLSGEELTDHHKLIKLKDLHDSFFENLQKFGYSDEQMLTPLKCFWEYPLQAIEEGAKMLKKLKKVGKLSDYEEWMRRFF